MGKKDETEVEHSQADEDAKSTQSETLEAELKSAHEHHGEKEAEWQEGAEEVHKLEQQPSGSKKDYPKKGKGEYETFGEDETAPEGSPEHDRGIISG